MNADTPSHAGTGAPEQPSSSSPDSPPAEQEEEEEQAECTQAAEAGEEDEGDPTQRLSPPIPLDQLVQSLCGESTDGNSP